MRNATIAVFVLFAVTIFGQEVSPRRDTVRPPEMVSTMMTTAATLDPVVNACGDMPVLSCGTTRNASLGSCLSGEFYIDLYQITLQSGVPFTVRGTSSSTYPLLVTVQNSAGVVASNYGTGSVSVTYTPAFTGTYAIGVGLVSKYTTGSYSLQLTCGSTSTPTCRSSGTLVRGTTVSGSLTAADSACSTSGRAYYKVYAFDGHEGVPVRIDFGTDFPPYLSAESSNSSVRTDKYSDPVDGNFFYFYPTKTGQQWVWVGQDLDTPRNGSFTIRISDAPVEPCRRRAVGR